MGIVLDRPFPTFPNGFSAEIVADLRAHRTRRARQQGASGTEIIDELGPDTCEPAR